MLEREEVPSEDVDFVADEAEVLEIEDGAANPRQAIGEGEAVAFARILRRWEAYCADEEYGFVERGEESRVRVGVC